MTGECGCAQTLWTPGENPVGNPASRAHDSTLFMKDKSFIARDDLPAAVLGALDLLAARVGALEDQLDALYCVIDSPLSPTESIERLRALRAEM